MPLLLPIRSPLRAARAKDRPRRGAAATAATWAALAAACAAVGVAPGAPVLARASAPAAMPRMAPTVRALPVTRKVVALTFDDGPNPRYTPALIRLLADNGARATFFVVGQEALRFPDLVRAEAKAGMEIGNHGMHHRLLRGLDEREVEAEASENAELIRSLTGRRPTLYRLPQGVGDTAARAVLGRLGYVLVNWSVDTRDYLRQSPEALVRRALRQLAPGRIVIFHDGGGNRQASVDAVRMLLPELRRQGYTVTTVGALMREAGFWPFRPTHVAPMPGT
jgi:peptidoglycan/xylan/chitin deacetylase (PgdA/CDA1 family)